jgi:beta-mannosidase
MQKYYLFVLLLSIACGCNTSDKYQEHKILLNENWSFAMASKEDWLPAEIPGTVHTDLLNNNEIDDPFYGLNEKKLQWIEQEDWTYKTSFELKNELDSYERLDLVFEGIDTYADVYLNDSLLFAANNMFIPWEKPVKDLLENGENEILVKLKSPVNQVMPKYNSLGYEIPVNSEQAVTEWQEGIKTSVYTRKAQFHYGWDWAPRYVTSGIWRPVYLKAWNDARITDVFYQLNELNENAVYDVHITIESLIKKQAGIHISLNGNEVLKKNIQLEPGLNEKTMTMTIENPKLWWPNGLGEPYLYEAKAALKIEGNNIALHNEKIGVRTVELIQEEDSIGTSFYFEVNGVPVFMKGANYVPLDFFFPRVTEEKYRYFIESAKKANMNMLRIWGGGIYENEFFYNLCDQHGIMIWQDFMFSNSMVPGNKAFLNNVEKEANTIVRQLRNHPCMASYCGNNEVLMFWNNRWKHIQDEPRGKPLWEAYQDIFYNILPNAVEKNDPDKSYWPSSPSTTYDTYHADRTWKKGNQHNWNIYFGCQPIGAYTYRKNLGRFSTEFGLQSYPFLKTVNTFAKPDDYGVYSAVMQQHHKLRLGNGNEIMFHYILNRYPEPNNFEHTLYISQVMQAEGMKTAIEALRRNKPWSMGSLYWQLNDVWPVTSWSGLDYYGNWKALHYAVKKAYSPVLISPVVENDRLRVYAVSDKLENVTGTLKISSLQFSGPEWFQDEMDINVPANEKKRVADIPLSLVLKNHTDTLNTVIYTTFKYGNNAYVTGNKLYFSSVKNLNLPDPNITSTFRYTDEGITIRLNADVLAKSVYLESNIHQGHFSDNFFDLLPGESKEVLFTSPEKISMEKLKGSVKIKTIVDAF